MGGGCFLGAQVCALLSPPPPRCFELHPLSLKRQQNISHALNLVNLPSKSTEGMGKSMQLVIVFLLVIAKGFWGTRGAHGCPVAVCSDLFLFPDTFRVTEKKVVKITSEISQMEVRLLHSSVPEVLASLFPGCSGCRCVDVSIINLLDFFPCFL